MPNIIQCNENCTCKCHVDISTKIRRFTILGRDLLMTLGTGIYFYITTIVGGLLPWEGCTVSMVGLSYYDLKFCDA